MNSRTEPGLARVSLPSVGSSLGMKLLPGVLSVTAGSVDAIGFLGLGGLFTSHITGNLVVLAAHLANGEAARLAPMLSVPVFMLVLMLVRLLASILEAAEIASLRPFLLLQRAPAEVRTLILTHRMLSPPACSASPRWQCRTHSSRYR
jgi:uncharacterized membrane protein YoaK (UPF0700 family)